MDTWIFQMNYPLVTVNRDYLTGTATVAQVGEKYMILGRRSYSQLFYIITLLLITNDTPLQDRFLRIPDPDDTLPSKYK
jgi:hypothetical protein